MHYFLFAIFLFFLPLSIQGSNIAVVTMAIGDQYRQDVWPGIRNKRTYCNKHGYDFFLTKHPLDPTRPIPWAKILILKNIIETKEYDWLFWTDADSLIMNHQIKLEEILEDNERADIIITKDFNDLNSGQFFIKCNEWSLKFLDAIYNFEDYIHHPLWENAAIIDLYNHSHEVQQHFCLLPQRIMNSYCKGIYGINDQKKSIYYKKGDFIIHFAGIRGKNLPRLMREYEKQIIE